MHHTTGPWTYTKNGRVVGPEGNTIADCRYKNGSNDGPLIAAAWELLEALKYVIQVRKIECSTHPDGFDDICANCKVRAAIAKAEGRP
jgi:hypothetical protein